MAKHLTPFVAAAPVDGGDTDVCLQTGRVWESLASLPKATGGERITFDERAANYHAHVWHVQYAERLVALAELRQGAVVLDVATGTGLAARAAARCVGETGRVVGVDISPRMLDRARAVTSGGEFDHLSYALGDATACPSSPLARSIRCFARRASCTCLSVERSRSGGACFARAGLSGSPRWRAGHHLLRSSSVNAREKLA